MSIDIEAKQMFRDNLCNIVEMSSKKVANVPKGYKISNELQSQEDFDRLVDCKNWAVSQTKDSQIIFFDLDHNNSNPALNKFLNRNRDKYVNDNEKISSKHGFLKITDATQKWLIDFAEKYHNVSGMEIYAQKHHVIFSGKYDNPKNKDARQTQWFDSDSTVLPIMEFTKEDLALVFSKIKIDNSIAKSNTTIDEIIEKDFVINEGENRGVRLLQYLDSRFITNPEFLEDQDIMLSIANAWNRKHCEPNMSAEKVEGLIKQASAFAIDKIKNRPKTDDANLIAGLVNFPIQQNHNVIIKHALLSAKEIIKSNGKINSDKLLPLVIQSISEFDMKDYDQDGNNHEQLLEILEKVSTFFNDSETFHKEILESKSENRYAHVNKTDLSTQFNCWYWNGTNWADDTAYSILQDLERKNPKKASSKLAMGITNKLSASDKTLSVTLDDPEYVERMMNIVTNSSGQYFDFIKGKIRDVDPSILFYKDPQLAIKFEEESETPTEFLKFCDEKFPNKVDKDIFIDHLAGSLLHTSVLGSKPKMLFVVGEHDSYKSLIIEIMKKIVATQSVSKVSVEQLSSRWGLSFIADKIFNYSEEENAVTPRDPANLKECITIESGYVEDKFGKKLRFVSRFPRHMVMSNKIAPIAKDDDDDSIFIRNQYLTIEKFSSKDWRPVLLAKSEIQRIGMFLLNRASEIFNGAKINTQNLEASKARHKELTVESIDKFLKENCITKGISSDIGTSFSWVLAKYNATMKSAISSKALTQVLEDIGHEKKIRTRVFRYSKEPNVFNESPIIGITDDNPTQQTIIMGLKPTMIETTATPRKESKSEKVDGLSMIDES
jgi:hypothetical protein